MASGYCLMKIKPKSHPIVSRFNRNELETEGPSARLQYAQP
jgi:hypothetical protein